MSRHNLFFFIRTFWGSLRHAEWAAASARAGIFGLIAEFFRAIIGFSAWPFFVPSDSGWQPETIRPILNSHGIPNWGWGLHGGEFFFQVKLRQASWAQYLLQQQGVPISGQLLDEGGRSAYRPAPRPTPTHGPTATHVPTAKTSSSPLTDPVGQINRTVDRLAKW
jgi:hypothetical protein